MNDYERVAKTVGLTVLIVTLVGTAIALFVMAPDAFFLIFLAILFAILLAHTAAYLQRWLPVGYSWNLALVIFLLLAGTVASGFLFGSSIQQQVHKTSEQLDQAGAQLDQWLQEHRSAQQFILGVPVLGQAVEELIKHSDQSGETSERGDAPAGDQPAEEEPVSAGIPKQKPKKSDAARSDAARSDAARSEDARSEDARSEDAKSDAAEEEADDTTRNAEDTADKEDVSQSSAGSAADSSEQDESSEENTLDSAPLSGQALSALGRVFSTTFGALTSLAIIIFVGIFLATDPQLYSRGLVGLFPPSAQPRAAEILKRLDHVLFHWLVGILMTMCITGIGTGIGLWILGVPLAGTVGTITALLTFIPNLGAVLALLLAMLLALSQGAATVMWVIALYLLLQLVESNVITPLIQQQQTSIPPALLIAFQLLVGMLTGFLGLMVATPLLAALMVIVDELWYTEPSDVL